MQRSFVGGLARWRWLLSSKGCMRFWRGRAYHIFGINTRSLRGSHMFLVAVQGRFWRGRAYQIFGVNTRSLHGSHVFGGCARAVLARKGIPDLWRQHAQLAWKSCVFFLVAVRDMTLASTVAGFGYASRGACISKPATCHPQHLPPHLSGGVFLYDLVQLIYDG